MDQLTSTTFRAHAAETGEPVEPEFASSTAADVDAACAAAAGAFESYRAIPAEKRAEFLDAIAEEIIALGDELIERASLESGLPIARITGERGRTTGQLKLFAQVLRDGHYLGLRVDPAMPDREPLPRPDLRMRKIPVGPVAVFGASNFPLAFSTAGGDTASALAAGCPVIVKGHPAHPGTDKMVAGAILKAAEKTGMPPGVFGHVMGTSNELGGALVADPRITAVGFTGSRAGGLALVRIAQQRDVPIPVYAEMSSINPVVLFPGALAEKADALGKGFVGSLTLGAGQFCVNPGLVLALKSDDLTAFEASAAEALGDHSPQTMLTTGITDAFAKGTRRLEGMDKVSQLAKGKEGNDRTCAAARLFAVEASDLVGNPDMMDEVFGASSIVVRCDDFDQVRSVLEGLEGQLTTTIHVTDADAAEARKLIPVLEETAGRIVCNGWPTGVEVAHAMVHGGPYPATSDGRTTSVGTLAIDRFLRPVCYQDMPAALLPEELKDGASQPRMVDGKPA